LTDISRDHRRIARLGMRQGEGPAADHCISQQAILIPIIRIERGRAFHVAELSDIEMYVSYLSPTKQNIGRALDQALSLDDSMTFIVERGRSDKGCKGRCLGFL